MKQYRLKKETGLVIGKFYPFHLGHVLLIETALSKVKDLTVIICDKKGQKIPGKLRKQWILEKFPTVKIKIIDSIYGEDDSEIWAKMTKIWLGFIPEFVFTSEDYGDAYCQFLGSKHVPVDKKRLRVPVSGTKIRNNPEKYLNFLPAQVKSYYESNIRIRS